MKVLAGVVLAAGLSAAGAPDARADIELCNGAKQTYHFVTAINPILPLTSDYTMEGWWSVSPGGCVTVLHINHGNNVFYMHATGEDGSTYIAADGAHTQMCVIRGKKIRRQGSSESFSNYCPPGYEPALFNIVRAPAYGNYSLTIR